MENPFSFFRQEGSSPLYVSGQLPIDDNGEITSLDLFSQTVQVLKNIESILKQQGLNRSSVLKTTVYTTDISKIEEINRAYNQFFVDPKPARSAVEVRKLAKDSQIEIDAVAYN